MPTAARQVQRDECEHAMAMTTTASSSRRRDVQGEFHKKVNEQVLEFEFVELLNVTLAQRGDD